MSVLVLRYLVSFAARIQERMIGERTYQVTRRLNVHMLDALELAAFAQMAAENRGHN